MSDILRSNDVYVFLGSASISAVVLMLALRYRRRSTSRLRELSSRREKLNPSETQDDPAGSCNRLMYLVGSKLLSANVSKRSTLVRRMQQAGFSSSASIYVFAVIRLLLTLLPLFAVSSLAAGGVLSPRSLVLVTVIGVGAGFILPSLWLDYRKKRRQQTFTRSLPDFFDLLTTCIESGLALEAAVKRVSIELTHAHPSLSSELLRVDNEINLGTAPNVAFENFAERADLECIRSFASLIKQTRMTGASVGEALRVNAEMMRTQREQRAEEFAQKAAVKVMIPTLLLIFPSVFIVLAGPAVIQLTEKFGASQQVSSSRK